jgi:hypothetical protein
VPFAFGFVVLAAGAVLIGGGLRLRRVGRLRDPTRD